MAMPGRSGYATSQGGWASSGATPGLPATLSIGSRWNNQPVEYIASQRIELTSGFESGTSDEFVAYITNGSGGGASSGGLASEGYRYGFNGKENDNEVKETGNQQDYGERIYDTRAARFLSTDPLTKSYPMLTPYQYASNNPIWMIDLDGLEGVKFSDVWHGKGNLVDWFNENSVEMTREVNQRINPVYQLNAHLYEIRTGKDFNTGAEKGRARAVSDFGVNAVMWVTFGRLVKAVSGTPVEAQLNQNARALGTQQPKPVQTQAMATEAEASTASKPKMQQGSGTTSGVIELNSSVKSTKGFINGISKKARDFVYDPTTEKFAMAGSNAKELKHYGLRQVIGATEENVVGGRIKLSANGEILTSEWSGTYRGNWTPEIATKFKEFIKTITGKKIDHSGTEKFTDGSK